MRIASKFAREAFKARMEHGYTQYDVAEAVSISVRWYQKIESGRRLPGTVTAFRIILFLDINIEKFREEVGLNVPISTIQRKTVFK